MVVMDRSNALYPQQSTNPRAREYNFWAELGFEDLTPRNIRYLRPRLKTAPLTHYMSDDGGDDGFVSPNKGIISADAAVKMLDGEVSIADSDVVSTLLFPEHSYPEEVEYFELEVKSDPVMSPDLIPHFRRGEILVQQKSNIDEERYDIVPLGLQRSYDAPEISVNLEDAV